MSREPRHRAEHSAAEIHSWFADAFERLGTRQADGEVESAMMRLSVDGVPLGDREPEFRRPNSNFYATRYLEARATARMLVELGIDIGVVDILRGDAPDVAVDYEDGRHLFVEHAVVLDEGAHRLSLAVEDANAAIWEIAARTPAVARVLDAGMLTIRLENIDLRQAFKPAEVASEILTIASGLNSRVDLLRPDSQNYPLLAAMDARLFYRPGAPKAGPISSPAFHGRMSVFEGSFNDVLAKKIAKAHAYPKTCRPLWLLLTVDMHFPNVFAAIQTAERTLSNFDYRPFERVIVQTVGTPPLVVP